MRQIPRRPLDISVTVPPLVGRRNPDRSQRYERPRKPICAGPAPVVVAEATDVVVARRRDHAQARAELDASHYTRGLRGVFRDQLLDPFVRKCLASKENKVTQQVLLVRGEVDGLVVDRHFPTFEVDV